MKAHTKGPTIVTNSPKESRANDDPSEFDLIFSRVTFTTNHVQDHRRQLQNTVRASGVNLHLVH
jgi:hypothetical protein